MDPEGVEQKIAKVMVHLDPQRFFLSIELQPYQGTNVRCIWQLEPVLATMKSQYR